MNYCVNLAGGTRYMALAVQQVFERFKSEFFYVQVEENLIVKSAFDELHKALTDICVNSKDGITSIYP